MEPVVKSPTLVPATYEETAEMVRAGGRLLPRGGGSKPALSSPPAGYSVLDLTDISGIVEYDPSEFTITARAGTPLRVLIAALAEHGQYLPWDPPLVEAGATLGGAIAAGLSGSGRYRYGGLRDFLVGIRFIDGTGRLVRGGGKVVKNAAGFDLPKLFVGSMGRLGVLVEATFKVFPQPPAWTTLRLAQRNLADAQRTLAQLAHAPLDLNALDVEIGAASQPVIWLRLGGLAAALPERAERLRSYLGAQGSAAEIVAAASEGDWWRENAALGWTSAEAGLLYASLLPSRLAEVDAALDQTGAQRRYLCGASIAWIVPAQEDAGVESALERRNLSAVRVRGAGAPLLGARGVGLLQRVKATLDPQSVFPSW